MPDGCTTSIVGAVLHAVSVLMLCRLICSKQALPVHLDLNAVLALLAVLRTTPATSFCVQSSQPFLSMLLDTVMEQLSCTTCRWVKELGTSTCTKAAVSTW